ncbi:MAG: hypothetical protein WDZ63_12215 [Burkholderiales bacterium]
MTKRWICAAAAALLVSPAAAEEEYPFAPERLAQVYDNETARLDMGSVRDRAGMRTFDVLISANNPAALPSGAAAVRTVRYFARCATNEMAIGGVALLDSGGSVLKSVIVPPGTWEYFKPGRGTREAEWLGNVC